VNESASIFAVWWLLASGGVFEALDDCLMNVRRKYAFGIFPIRTVFPEPLNPTMRLL
jgi:hypothetical protein